MSRRQPLKILFLTSSYPRNAHDVASVFLRYFAEALAGRGNEVHVLAPADGYSESKQEGNINVHRFQYFPLRWQKLAYGSGIMSNLSRSPLLWLQVPFYILSMTYRLLRLMRQEKFDLLHAHWIVPQGLIGVLAKSIHQISLVTTAHGADAFALKGWLNKFIKRLVVAKSDAWTTNTPATASAIDDGTSARSVRVIPMGVDIARFANGDRAALRAFLAEENFLLLFVGRLVEKKGFPDLIKACALLKDWGVSFRCEIVGSGPLAATLEHSIADLGLEKLVRLRSQMPQQELGNHYLNAMIFALPCVVAANGDRDILPNVVKEAMAVGVPVITTRLGGIEELVAHEETGLLVPPGDIEALAESLKRLLTDAKLRRRLANQARRVIEERFNLQVSFIPLGKLLGEMVEERAGQRVQNQETRV